MPDSSRHAHRGQGRPVEIFVEPSAEARLLLRHLGWLVAPEEGNEGRLARAVGAAVVAPFTQFTLFSFDLQVFLFEIFHQTRTARLGHLVFMAGVNFFAMAVLAGVPLAAGVPGASGATAYAVLLLAWYAALAYKVRLAAWWLVTAPIVALLCLGAHLWHAAALDAAQGGPLARLAWSPWLWLAASALLIALSHLPEPKLPPRFTGSDEWLPLDRYLLGAPGERLPASVTALRALRLALLVPFSALDEGWAAPRLLPYNFLMLMFQLGYAPELYARIRDHVDRALASGNPALDFVGIGGGAYLRDPDAR